MRLHNTLTRKIQDFKPLKENEVTLYTCGPTVYDFAQLGNLRSFVFEDTLRRVLQASGYNVRHVMNITDVGHLVSDEDEGEDKLEKGAAREGKTVWDLAAYYIDRFKSDVKKLNILEPNGYQKGSDHYARATDFIEEQIEIIKLLIEKGFAYKTSQAIYFDTAKLPSYGELTGQKLSEKETGARKDVVTDAEKKHPQDFAVWFFTVGRFEHHDMRWPSPWGEGFPGWHLECSAIIHATLGDPIDIHTGGVDHIGTHHPNEMAQTEAAFGHRLANYWVHNEFLLVDGKKMSKSAGNFYTLKDIIDKGYDPVALRLLFLQSHYRSQMNFTWEAMDAAQNRLKDLQAAADIRHQPGGSAKLDFDSYKSSILQHLKDDLNTPQALAILSNIGSELTLHGTSDQQGLNDFLGFINKTLGINLLKDDISDQQKELIAQREAARASQDWTAADKLRQQLSAQGIEINDTERGPIWYRNN